MKPFVLAGILLVAPAMATAQYQITPESYTFQANAGDKFNQSLDVEWTGSQKVVTRMESEITAENTNSNGIELSYSQQNFSQAPGTNEKVVLMFDTHSGLKPDNFTVNTTAVVESEIGEESSSDGNTGSSGGSGGYSSPEIIIGDSTSENISDNESDNVSDNESYFEPIENKSENKSEDRNFTINESIGVGDNQTGTTPGDDKDPGKEAAPNVIYAILLVLGLLVLISILGYTAYETRYGDED